MIKRELYLKKIRPFYHSESVSYTHLDEMNMMKIALIAVSVIAVIILGAGVGFYFYKKKMSGSH